MMESPETAASMAWAMVLQAVVADVQLLPSLPLTPSTYQVVATAAGANAAAKAMRSKALSSLYCMISSIWFDQLVRPRKDPPAAGHSCSEHISASNLRTAY